MRGTGRVIFAATLLLLVGTLNVIYGIGALDDANIFKGDTRYVLDDLNTLGWVLIVLGIIQLTAGFSLMAGQRVRALHGDLRRQHRRDRRAVLDRQGIPVVVAVRLCPLHLHRARHHGLQRRRGGRALPGGDRSRPGRACRPGDRSGLPGLAPVPRRGAARAARLRPRPEGRDREPDPQLQGPRHRLAGARRAARRRWPARRPATSVRASPTPGAPTGARCTSSWPRTRTR